MLQDSIRGAESAAGHSLKRSEVSAYWSAKARDYIANNFGAWLKLLGLKIVNFWNAFRYDDLSVITTLREEGVTLPGISFGLVAALAIPGLVLAFRRFPLSRWVAAAIGLHMLSLLGVFVTERYRLAAVPGLLLFAALVIGNFGKAALTRYRRCLVYCLFALERCFGLATETRTFALGAGQLQHRFASVGAESSQDVAQKLDLAYAYVPDNAELNFALGNLRLAQGREKRQSHITSPLCASIRAMREVTTIWASSPLKKATGNWPRHFLPKLWNKIRATPKPTTCLPPPT